MRNTVAPLNFVTWLGGYEKRPGDSLDAVAGWLLYDTAEARSTTADRASELLWAGCNTIRTARARSARACGGLGVAPQKTRRATWFALSANTLRLS